MFYQLTMSSVEDQAKDLFKALTLTDPIQVGFSYGDPCFPCCICCGKLKVDPDYWKKYGPDYGTNIWHCSDCRSKWYDLMLKDEKTVVRIKKEIFATWIKQFANIDKNKEWIVKD